MIVKFNYVLQNVAHLLLLRDTIYYFLHWTD